MHNVWNTPDGPAVPLCVTGRSPILTGMPGQVPPDPARDLRPAEVQALLGVSSSTLHDYETSGRLTARRTLGGHRRYPADQPALRDRLAAR